MNLQELADKLLRSARSSPSREAVPYAFEQRVMAQIRALPAPDLWAVWSAALWRAAMACLAITLLSSAWTLWASQSNSSQVEFSQEFESALVMTEPSFDEAW